MAEFLLFDLGKSVDHQPGTLLHQEVRSRVYFC